jgi:hypothetical protein
MNTIYLTSMLSSQAAMTPKRSPGIANPRLYSIISTTSILFLNPKALSIA